MNLFRFCLMALLAVALAPSCAAADTGGEELIAAPRGGGDAVPYILNYKNPAPKYVIILFPGGTGVMDPHLEDGKLVYQAKGNFLIRSRSLIVDDDFATVATNATASEERIQAVIDDLKRRFPGARIYLMGTSRGTYDTMSLAGYLSDKIAGEIHTSSLGDVSSFDARKYANRQLLVHHRQDSCKSTPFFAAQASHEKYGTELIVMDGGRSVGNPCEAFAYHGYNGIEQETVDAIKKWVRNE